jgi:polyhydroxybutyrate depolymerase
MGCSKEISHDRLMAVSEDHAVSADLRKMTWTVEGVQREALVYLPQDTVPLPILIAFHGHGGSDTGFSHKAFESYWPKAIVVYPQGLPTVSNGDQKGLHSGWQHSVGEVNKWTGVKDQDLKLFDSILTTFRSLIDTDRVYVHGWSNGGEFTYDVLWAERQQQIAAIAPASAVLNSVTGRQDKPVLHIAGTSDPVVSYSSQQNGFSLVRNLDECPGTTNVWATGANGVYATHYYSALKDKVIFLKYDGGHSYPDNVPALIAKFFRQVDYKLSLY